MAASVPTCAAAEISVPMGIVASAAPAAASLAFPPGIPSVAPEPDRANGEQCDSRTKLEGDPGLEWIVRIGDRLLEPCRNRDDAEDQPVVPVPERSQREA